MGRIVLTSKGFSWFSRGHPWIYRDDLEKIEDASSGDIVALENRKGKFLALGFYSERSKIAFRLITRRNETIDRDFWETRFRKAVEYRESAVARTNAYRLIYAESDGIPSFIVDRYAGHLSLQTLSPGPERLLPLFTEILSGLFRPPSMILRNDLAVRELEGLPQEKRVLDGNYPGRVEVFEGGIKYLADLLTGQKTGAYLDQRENRVRAGEWLRGRVLDGFCYNGLFALHAARNASEVTGVDSSQAAVDLAAENARLNGLANVKFRRGNVFDDLQAEADGGERYDGVILDPPAFAKSKGHVGGAVRGYKELNRRAIRLLNPGGILVTSSCSYNLSEEKFLEVLRDCEKDSGATLRLLEKRGQSVDHPVLLSFPESCYLKCLFLQKID